MDALAPFGVPEPARITLARQEFHLMLKLLDKAPDDLGKKGEVTKLSPTFDRATKDTADLRVYTSNDGKRTYLRVWETATKPDAKDTARWYVCEESPAAAPEEAATKKK